MNKLKWKNFEEETNLNFLCFKYFNPKAFVKFFNVSGNLICFFEDLVVFFEININEKLSLVYKGYFNIEVVSFNEKTKDIKQNSAITSSFLLLTSNGNIILLSLSFYESYVEVLKTIKTNKNNILIHHFYKNTFIVEEENSLWLYSVKESKEKIASFSNQEKINKCFLVNDDIIGIATQNEIFLLKRSENKKTIIWSFEEKNNFKPFTHSNLIYYIKSLDEFAIYHLQDQKNNFSLKFSSKKIINKITFNEVIHGDNNIILLSNDSKGELYIYCLKYNSFNRETSVFENRNYLVIDDYVICLGINLTTMILKGKYSKWNREQKEKDPNKEIQKTEKNIENVFDSLNSLENYEKEYEKEKEDEYQKVRYTNKIKREIENLIQKYHDFISYESYECYKMKLISYIKKIIIVSGTYEFKYNLKIYSTLIEKFIFSFGSRVLIFLDWYLLYILYFINEEKRKIEELLQVSICCYDYSSYKKLKALLKKLKSYN